jgi:glycerol-3-phosphate cytidylyltransferase
MKKIVYLPGVWDLLHVGHLNVIRRASLFGDYLIVGVCNDEIAMETKKHNVVINQRDRADLLLGIKYVDEVFIYENVDQSEQLKMLTPDIFAIGEDFGEQGVPEHELALIYCKENNITIKRIPRLKGISTSKIKSGIN